MGATPYTKSTKENMCQTRSDTGIRPACCDADYVDNELYPIFQQVKQDTLVKGSQCLNAIEAWLCAQCSGNLNDFLTYDNTGQVQYNYCTQSCNTMLLDCKNEPFLVEKGIKS